MKCECSEFFGEACDCEPKDIDTTIFVVLPQDHGTARTLGSTRGLLTRLRVTEACADAIQETAPDMVNSID